jgi:tetratricopeptide (TPR) repeat protein
MAPLFGEGVMANAAVTARKSRKAELAALDRAQDLIYSAWEAATEKQHRALAQKALHISPLCADAYVLLAQHESFGSKKSIELLRQGLEAGKKALGGEFEEFVGEFWGFLETRPYMRAREALAFGLWAHGSRKEAIDHLKAMLVLNPNDNQGVRYVLVRWLIETDRDDDVGALLASYPEDDMAMWTYPTALAVFRREGDSDGSRKLLETALESNKHVPGYLLGDKPIPKTRPFAYSPGEKDEAVIYVSDFGDCWHHTPGALEWLRSHQSAPKMGTAAQKNAKTKTKVK